MVPKLALAALIAAGTNAAIAQPVSVPSDPRARYEILQLTRKAGGMVEVLTRREGPSGVSFALREVDCRGQRFRYLSEGDTREQAMRRNSTDRLGPLMTGSISWHVAQAACR